MHNFPAGAIDPLFVRCMNRTRPNDHVHQQLQGWSKGHGSRATLAQVYPIRFCNRLASLLYTFFKNKPSVHPREQYLVEDLLDLANFQRHESKALSNYAICRVSGSFDGVAMQAVSLSAVPVTAKPLLVVDSEIKQLLVLVNSLPKHTELPLHEIEHNLSHVGQTLIPLTQKLRKIYLPNQRFNSCCVMRGTLGNYIPVWAAGEGEKAYVIMWNKKDNVKQVYVSHVSIGTDWTKNFDPSHWSIVVFWSESSDSKPDPVIPPDINLPDAPTPPDLPPERPDAPMYPPQDDTRIFDDPDRPVRSRSRSREPPDTHDQDNPDPPQPPSFPGFPGSGVRIRQASRDRSRSRDQHDDHDADDQHPTIVPIEPEDADMTDPRLGGESLPDSRTHQQRKRSRSPPARESSPPVRESKPKARLSPTASSSTTPEKPKKLKEDEDEEENIPSTSTSSTTPAQGGTVSLPIAESDDEDEDSESVDSQRTIPYADYLEDLYVIEDGSHWSYLSSEAKILATTGSFTVPRDIEGNPIDIGKLETLPITAHTLFVGTAYNAVGNRTSGCSRADIEEDMTGITEEDRLQLTLCYKTTATTKGQSTAARAAKKRKEASTTEMRTCKLVHMFLILCS